MASRSMIATRKRGEHATTSMFETGSVIPSGVVVVGLVTSLHAMASEGFLSWFKRAQ
jgi:hypothetical protein